MKQIVPNSEHHKCMQNFTNDELRILRGVHSVIGRKYRKSGRYVSLIAQGKREVNTRVAKLIFKDLRNILEILKPEEKEY
ncbi:hypothetical protein AB832_01275 [Flavobacteriaceae bacterium (ex Bugula neritina AB1)]|nr:hypothetical protein AB832_01275 [Flavobacteriaceae bacterium (ex Bugula neritina AB1)]